MTYEQSILWIGKMKREIDRELSFRPRMAQYSKAVHMYALDLLSKLEENLSYDESGIDSMDDLKKKLLNGADNWSHYSWGGCSLVYDYDIAKRVCTPSEFKRKREGALSPRRGAEWLDIQAGCLKIAAYKITRRWKEED